MSNYEITQRKRNILVGIFVLTAVLALIWLIMMFGEMPLVVGKFRSFQVNVQFPTASGVQENTPVRFCGYRVGRVLRVEPPKLLEDLNTHKFYHQAVVVLAIDKQFSSIPRNVEVKLMMRGLGSSYIELKEKPPSPGTIDTEFLIAESLLQGSTGMTSEFFPEESQQKLDELVEIMVSLLNNANEIFGDKENKENFKATLANLSESSEEAKSALQEFQKFVTVGVEASEELSKTIAQLRLILEKINEGQGTLAKLVNDGRLYENLLESTQQLDVLMQELKTLIEQLKEKGISLL